MQIYKILNHDGYNEHAYGSEVSLSSEETNSWIAGGAKLQNVTPLPTIWERHPDSFIMEPSDSDCCKASCSDGYAHALCTYNTLALTISLEDLSKRSYWAPLALEHAEMKSEDESSLDKKEKCKKDCYEGWLRGAVGYCKAIAINMTPINVADLYQLGAS